VAGVKPPAANRVGMMSEGSEKILDAPWLSAWLGLEILVLILEQNIVGEGLRDATDPRLWGER
jgi:peptide/nickel transport system permease protein